MVLFRFVLGLVKGAVIGGIVGLALVKAGLAGAGWAAYAAYGATGLLAGLLCGRPIWSHALDRQSTVLTAILKGLFGAGVGAGLYAVAGALHGGPSLSLHVAQLGAAGEGIRPLAAWPIVFGPLVGAIYGAFVEIDDGGGKKAVEQPAKK